MRHLIGWEPGENHIFQPSTEFDQCWDIVLSYPLAGIWLLLDEWYSWWEKCFKNPDFHSATQRAPCGFLHTSSHVKSVAQQSVCMSCECESVTFRTVHLPSNADLFSPDGRRGGQDVFPPIPRDMALPWQQKQDCSILSSALSPALVPEEIALSGYLNWWFSPLGETKPASINYSSPDHLNMHICRRSISSGFRGILWKSSKSQNPSHFETL